MYKEIIIEKVKKSLVPILAGLVIVICTFPSNEWTYSFGIDPALTWCYNYFFNNDLSLTKDIIFPHGPLAFFMYPLPENIILTTIVVSILKFLLVYNLLLLLSEQNKVIKWSSAIVIAYSLSLVVGINHLILVNVILIYCSTFLNKDSKIKYIAYLLTAFALYVKSYVAIISGLIFLSFIIYNLISKKDVKTFLIDSLFLLTLNLLFWIIMYGTFDGFIDYLWGMFQLAQDNSSAVSYYPKNNWLVMSLFIFSIPLLFIINRNKKFMFYSILIGLSLFAAWKHGMARQDIHHMRGFLIYVLICSVSLLVFYRKSIIVNTLIVSFALGLLYFNIKSSTYYQELNFRYFQADNFIQFVSDFKNLKIESNNKSQNDILVNKLPDNILDSIGDATVDVYPWDYSIIPVNNLNWQPRVVINSYAAYTPWLDKQNAMHFKSEKSAQYIIWEKEKISSDVNGGKFNSIDERYLLNDEPQTIIELLRNYEYWYSNNRFLILKKRKREIDVSSKISSEENIKWSTWQNVPKLIEGQLLRAKLNFRKSFLQRFKSFIYKDEQFWIYLKLEDNSIHKYRIVPQNASDGLWINPYLINYINTSTVKQIMFKASNEDILSEELSVNWETFSFNTKNIINEFFAIIQNNQDSTILQSANSFEIGNIPNWSIINNESLSIEAFEGEKSFLLKPDNYSCAYSISLDSISKGNIKIEAGCWIKNPDYKESKNILIVISIDNDNGNVIWKGLHIDNQLFYNKNWNHINNYLDYNNIEPNCTLKVYLWNTDDSNILIDNFTVMISKSNDSDENN